LNELEKEQQIQRVILETATELLREVHGPIRKNLQINMKFDQDLGLDSLTRVELMSRLERILHVTIADELYNRIETLEDLKKLILESHQRVDIAKAGQSENFLKIELVVPESAKTLLDVLDWYYEKYPERIHIEMYQDDGKGQVISYAKLDRESAAVAANLVEKGLKNEQAVVIMLPTSEDYFYVFWGILRAGGIPVPIYPPTRIHQIGDHIRRHVGILKNCQARMIVTLPEARGISKILEGYVQSLAAVLTAEELREKRNSWQPIHISSEQTAFLQYTSGSTGQPKGVVLTHKNILHSIRAMGQMVNANSRDIFLSWLPLYHDMGLIGAWFGTLYFGAKLVVMSPLSFLSRPERWLWAIHRHRATLTAAPNFAFEICVRKIEEGDLAGLDLSSLRMCSNGAEPVSAQTIAEFSERFSRFGFRPKALTPVYGLAENTLALTFTPLDRGPKIDVVDRNAFQRFGEARPSSSDKALKFVSCGIPLRENELRIVDDKNRELTTRREGRLHFRGPASTKGYFQNPEKTAELFQDGWLDSGDLAYIAEGELYLTGRIKDVIIRAGRKIHPFELEQAVGSLVGVRRGGVVVFGLFDEKAGTERLVVIAETSFKNPSDLEALQGQVHLVVTECTGAPADEVQLVPAKTVLKTSSGKIRRSACREAYVHQSFGRARPLWWQFASLRISSIPSRIYRLYGDIKTQLYSIYVWALFIMILPLAILTLIFVPTASLCRRVLRSLLLGVSFLTGLRLHIEGKEKLRDLKSEVIFVSNHASYLDAFVLVAALDFDFCFVAKAELKNNYLIAWLLRRLNAVYVERFEWGQSARDAQMLVDIARSSPPLLIFPEGTFTPQSGLRPFHLGAFLVAAQLSRPVVPLVIKGTRDILRDGSWVVRKGTIKVFIGDAVKLKNQAMDTWSAALNLSTQTRAQILEKVGEPSM
jgi:acyl carrier protein